jgi:restriction system protein
MSAKSAIVQAVPKYSALLYPTLKAIKALGGSGSNDEILDKVCELEKYSDAIQKIQHSDNRRSSLNYNLHWARTYLKIVDAIVNNQRGIWTITAKGAGLSEDDCKLIPTEARKLSLKKRNAKNPVGIENTTADDENSWREDLIATIRNQSPSQFERLAQRMLREAGFTKVEVTGKSGDGGVDGLGILRVNLVSFTVLFQCKRYQGSVGARAGSGNLHSGISGVSA